MVYEQWYNVVAVAIAMAPSVAAIVVAVAKSALAIACEYVVTYESPES